MQKRSIAPTSQDVEQLTSLFRILSDPTRLSILFTLADGEKNVSELSRTLALPQPTVSHHLGLLRVNNVIGNRRAGKQVFYELNGTPRTCPEEFILNVQRFAIRIEHRDS